MRRSYSWIHKGYGSLSQQHNTDTEPKQEQNKDQERQTYLVVVDEQPEEGPMYYPQDTRMHYERLSLELWLNYGLTKGKAKGNEG